MLKAPKSDGTVGKALQVLDQVAEFRRPVRFAELLENSPFPKPTLYRFVQTLTNQGMLSFDPDRQTYAMGVRLVRLAHSAWWNDSQDLELGKAQGHQLHPLARLASVSIAWPTSKTPLTPPGIKVLYA